MADILDEHVKDKNQAIHLLKIDVEGFKRGVLEGMDFCRFRPWLMMIEAIFSENWEDIVLRNGYRHVYSDELNKYYADASNIHCYDLVKKT
ncbi:MAG: FkbM family methyltransferase [Synergistaceae bacterium]|nr:FkbM family methyltransferase [Synergistaceae bacterium]